MNNMKRTLRSITITLEGKQYDESNWQELCRHIEWGNQLIDFITDWMDEKDYIIVQTSGSTGKPKKIFLPKKMMATSALMTGRYLGLKPGDKALLCLPVEYIAGKMMIVRSIILGLDLYPTLPATIPEINQEYAFSAMTPHQLASLLKTRKADLGLIEKLVIGGGSLDPGIAGQLRELKTQCYLSYGMTETSSHIALQKINGPDRSEFFELIDKDIRLIQENDGRLSITGGFLGERLIKTNDIIRLTDKTTFQWLGRSDFVINSGGIKVHPENLENRIRDLIPNPFIVTGFPDPVLQQQIVLVIETGMDDPDQLIKEISSRVLAREKPVKIFTIDVLPRTENGKIIRNIDFKTNIKLIWEKKV
jgi:O-succinylbenzoic acid--CoA ligase